MTTIPGEQDRLYVSPDRPPMWSENAVCIFNAPDAGLAVYTHFSRVAPDPQVWEGVLVIYLPDDELLVSRSFAAAQDLDRCDAGALQYVCVEPGEHWQLIFNGLTRRVTTTQLGQGFLTDGHAEPVKVDLAVRRLRPAWVIGHVTEGQSWGSFHLEQECRIEGTIEIHGEVLPVSTLGFRDLSRGVRQYDSLLSECWSHGFFPSGRSYQATQLENRDAPDLVVGFYFDGQTRHEVTRVTRPYLVNPLGDPREYEVAIGGEFGDLTIRGRLDHACPFGLDHPIGQPIGFDAGNPNGTLIVEGPATPTLEGERGYGWLERVAQRSVLSV